MATKADTSNANPSPLSASAQATDDQKLTATPAQPMPAVDAAGDTDATPQNTNVSGRSVFSVETTAAGVVVRTAFLSEDNRLLDMPAVFPNMMYAIDVIDDLRRQVMQHFSQAAQVGAQVIANQARNQQQQQKEQQQQNAQEPAVSTASTESSKHREQQGLEGKP